MELFRRHFAERFLVLLKMGLQIQTQGVLLPNLGDRSSAPIHVHGCGRVLVLLHPAGKIGTGSKVLATGEYALQSVAGPRSQVGSKIICGPVEIGEKSQCQWVIYSRQAVKSVDVFQGLISQNDKPGKMDLIKLTERHDRVFRICLSRE